MVSADNIVYQKGRPAPLTIETKFKDSDESVISSTTLQDDNDLTGFTIIQDTWYKIEGLLFFDAAADGMGIAMRFVSSVTVGDHSAMILVGSDTAGTLQNDVAQNTGSGGNLVVSDLTGFGDDLTPTLIVRGAIKGGSSSGTFKLQWAQASSQADNLTLKAGSWMTLSKLASLT